MFLFDKSDEIENQGSVGNNSKTFMNVDESIIEESIQDGKIFMSYYIMPKYGRNLDSYFNQFNMNFSNKTIF